MIRKLLFALAVIFCSAVCPLQAHSVWIEPLENGQLAVRFAEPGGKFETSPGHMDGLSVPTAFVISNTTPVSIDAARKSDHFLLASSATNSVCAETGFIVMTERGKNTPGKPGRRPLFYARWQPVGGGAAAPCLTLDIVPTQNAGEARVYFRGRPLGNVKATLHFPNDSEKEITADDEGFLRFKAEQPGDYLLTVAHHRENVPGFFGGWPYELTSHNAALSWRQK